jgi:hypothetical protein
MHCHGRQPHQEHAVANHNLPEPRDAALAEEPEPTWRPQDPEGRDPFGGDDPGDLDTGDLRDARRWGSDESDEVSPRAQPGWFTGRARERSGASPRGAEASRHGEDRLRELQGGARRDDRPSAGSFEDRHRELGSDPGIAAWPEPTGSDPWRDASRSGYRGRDFEPERQALSGSHGQRTGHAGAQRPGDERIGEPAGSYSLPAARGSELAVPGTGRDHAHHGTGPHRGKGPAGYQRSDERIRELVCESLTDDDEIDASQIEVSVTGGEVTLSGTVDDRRTKRAAEDCAYSAAGVRDVQNRLRVRDDHASWSNPPGGAAVDPHDSSAPGSKHRA